MNADILILKQKAPQGHAILLFKYFTHSLTGQQPICLSTQGASFKQ